MMIFMTITPEWAAVLIACVTMIGTFAVFMVRLTIKPFGEIIKNNTDAMTALKSTITKHDDILDDHETRIVRQETIHEVRGCGAFGTAGV